MVARGRTRRASSLLKKARLLRWRIRTFLSSLRAFQHSLGVRRQIGCVVRTVSRLASLAGAFLRRRFAEISPPAC